MKRWSILSALTLLTMLTGCGDDDGPTSVETPPATPAAFATLIATPMLAPTRAAVTADGYLTGDGVCEARVPMTWVEDAPGTGTTSDGHTFSVFGNQLVGPDAWTTAANLLRDQINRQPDAQLSENERSVRITYGNGAGLAYRVRFVEVYCDLRITGPGRQVTAAERATWENVIESLQPAG
jgi:hypothetical protein